MYTQKEIEKLYLNKNDEVILKPKLNKDYLDKLNKEFLLNKKTLSTNGFKQFLDNIELIVLGSYLDLHYNRADSPIAYANLKSITDMVSIKTIDKETFTKDFRLSKVTTFDVNKSLNEYEELVLLASEKCFLDNSTTQEKNILTYIKENFSLEFKNKKEYCETNDDLGSKYKRVFELSNPVINSNEKIILLYKKHNFMNYVKDSYYNRSSKYAYSCIDLRYEIIIVNP